MTNPYDLKVLELSAPWASDLDISELPESQKVSVDLLKKINAYSIRESNWELRFWTLKSGAPLADSYKAIFEEAWRRAGRAGYGQYDRAAAEFLEASRCAIPFEAENAYIETSRERKPRHDFLLSSSSIARVWFSLSRERRYDLVDFVDLDQEIANWILDNAVAESCNLLRFVPYARGPYELNEIVDATEVSSVYEAKRTLESQHFHLQTAVKVFARLEAGEATEVYNQIAERHPGVAGNIRVKLLNPEPIDSDASADLALEAKRVGRRRNTTLEDIIDAEVPYRIYRKPYEALRDKIAKQGDMNEIEVAVLEATDKHLLGMEILKRVSETD